MDELVPRRSPIPVAPVPDKCGNLVYPLINSHCPVCSQPLSGILYASRDELGEFVKPSIEGVQGLVLSPCEHRLPRGWGIIYSSLDQTAHVERLRSSFGMEIPAESEGEIIKGDVVDDEPAHLSIENNNGR